MNDFKMSGPDRIVVDLENTGIFGHVQQRVLDQGAKRATWRSTVIRMFQRSRIPAVI
ncbi:hypothetical protein VQ056_21565 [Paenibacillus sp. JTLBN-2024]